MPRTSEKTKEEEEEKNYQGDTPYKGTVRVVTEEDLQNDPRLVAASVVVGQLYDFSNLRNIPEDAAGKNVGELNKGKDRNAEATATAEEDRKGHVVVKEDEE
jgi:hypothetical protein